MDYINTDELGVHEIWTELAFNHWEILIDIESYLPKNVREKPISPELLDYLYTNIDESKVDIFKANLEIRDKKSIEPENVGMISLCQMIKDGEIGFSRTFFGK